MIVRLVKAILFLKGLLWGIINPVRTYLNKYFDYVYLISKGVETELGYVELKGLPIIHKHKDARIIIGKGTTLISKSKYNSAGINHPVILASLREGAILKIDGSFGASGSAIVAMDRIEIEEGAGLGANANVYDTDFHPVNWAKNTTTSVLPVKICKNAWVAANCLILKGVTIGENSVIAAGSVVTKSVEANSLYGGVPAKKIKDLH